MIYSTKSSSVFQTNRKRGFTLIEIMAALMLFGIGVVVLLRAIIYFIGAWDEIKKRAQATLLAKEAMDIVYNQRDTNLRRWVSWKCAVIDQFAPDDACSTELTIGKVYRAWFDGMSWYTINELQDWDSTDLFTQTVQNIQIYTHNTGTPTNFKREILVSDAILQGQQLPHQQVVKITVKVSYIPNQPERVVILESYLAAWEKTQ